MNTSDETKRTPSTGIAIGAGCLPIIVLTLVALPALLVRGVAQGVRSFEEAGPLALLILPLALFAAVVGGVLAGIGTRARVPAAITIGIATWPWLMGLAAAAYGASRAVGAIEYADPASRATMAAMGLSEALNGRVLGGVFSAAALAGVGLALGLASIAPRATNRVPAGALVGLLLGGIPLAAGLAVIVLGLGLASGLLIIVIAMIGAFAAALAGWGAGAAPPHDRSAALAAAAPVAGALALAAVGSVAATLPIIEVFGAIAYADPASRTPLLAQFGDEIALPSAIARWTWTLALIPCAALALWAARRARPSGGRIAGGALVVFVLIATLTIDALVEHQTITSLGALATSPWRDVAGFSPVVIDGRGGGDDVIVVALDRVEVPGEGSVPLADLESAGRQRLVAAFGAVLSRGDDVGDPSELTLAIAVDRRTPLATLRTILAIADEAGARSVTLVGVSSDIDPRTIERIPPVIRWAAEGAMVGGVRVRLPSSLSPGAAELDPRLLHAFVTAGSADAPLVVAARAGETGFTLGSDPYDGSVPDGEGELVYLVAEPSADVASVAAIAARIARAHRVPVLLSGSEVPGNPALPLGGVLGGSGLGGGGLGGGGLGGLGLGDGGLGGGGDGVLGLGALGTLGALGGVESLGGVGSGSGAAPPVAGAAEVRGSLSREVITRVVRAHATEVRRCYERQLSSQPALAGRLTVAFVIGASGAVTMASVRDSTLASPALEECIARAVRQWSFPAPDGGGVVAVSYPFVFAAAE